jgi:multiple sugar transport system permease protein
MKRCRRIRQIVGTGAQTVLLWIVILLFMFPLVWFLLLSIKPAELTFTVPPVFKFTPDFSAYRRTFIEGPYGKYLVNSLIIAGINTLVCFAIGLPAAFGLSRFAFPNKKEMLISILSVRMAPPIAVVLPFYLIMVKLRLVGSYIAPIVMHVTFNLPLLIWMMKGFMDDIPMELDESAMLDGCTKGTVLTRIILPLCTPGLVVSGTFCFIFSWNEFLFSMILTNLRTQPLTVATVGFWTTMQLLWNDLAAVAAVTVLPPLVVGILLRNFFIRGLTMGAIK